MNDFFDEEELISGYSRADALADGVLVDITELATEAGFKVPVAVTRGLFSILEPSEALREQGQDLKGRIWDVLWILRHEIKKADWTDIVRFAPLLILWPGGIPKPVKLWAKAGPGDKLELVITIMLEGED